MPRIVLAFVLCVLLTGFQPAALAKPSAVDAQAQSLLASLAIAAKQVRTLQAHVIAQSVDRGVSRAWEGRLIEEKPGNLREDLWEGTEAGSKLSGRMDLPHRVVIANDAQVWEFDGKDTLIKQPSIPEAFHIALGLDINALVSQQLDVVRRGRDFRYAGDETLRGATYQVVEFDDTLPREAGSDSVATGRAYIGADHLIHRLIVTWPFGSLDCSLTNVVVNAPVDRTLFALKNPGFLGKSATASSVQMDADSVRILANVDTRYATLTALTAQFTHSLKLRGDQIPVKMSNVAWHGTLELQKNDFARVKTIADTDAAKELPGLIGDAVSDGKYEWKLWDPVNKFYTKAHMHEFPVLTMLACPDEAIFFSAGSMQEMYYPAGAKANMRYAGKAVFHGQTCRIIQCDASVPTPTGALHQTVRLFVNEQNLFSRVDSHASAGTTVFDQSLQLAKIATPVSLPASEFTFNLPAGAIRKKPRSAADLNAESKMLAIGTVAPDFTAFDPAGKAVKLSDYAGKVVVIDFWATWCGPCQASLPSTNELARRYHSKGVVFLGVNVSDEDSAFSAWLPKHKDLTSIQFVIDRGGDHHDALMTLYGVLGIPAQFVIGADGKIAWSNTGYDGDEELLDDSIADAVAAASTGIAQAPR
ncbi:MAG: TlpA disulfide reductase family protein [Capsulimonadaceae bacterium]|nr:TlpA disulfide reductase family protein [Capsulimonadaceae bacterium]